MRRVVTKKISSYADVNVNINMSRQDNNLSWMRILKIELEQFSHVPYISRYFSATIIPIISSRFDIVAK